MQDRCPLSPSDRFSLGGIGRLACWLSQRTRAQAATLVVSAVAIVAALDVLFAGLRVGLAPLYIVPVALACWTFGTRTAIATTIGVTLMAAAKEVLLNADPSLVAVAGNILTRGAAYALLALIVLSFRHSYDVAKFLARHDRMTGALNKEAFKEQAARQLDMARFGQAHQMLVLLDLDGFKAVNDRHGHEAGDEVLQRFSAGAARELRAQDCFGRVGGDEFALLLEVGSAEGARELAHGLHRRLSAVLAATGYPVTCSMGALLIPAGDGHSRDELMRQADRLMYESKHTGKDAVRFDWAGSALWQASGKAPVRGQMPAAAEAGVA